MKMSITGNSGLINRLVDIKYILNTRNVGLFWFGIGIFAVAIMLRYFIRQRISLSLKTPKLLRELSSWAPFVGIGIIILSFVFTAGNGYGKGTESGISFTEPQEAISISDLTSFSLGQPETHNMEEARAAVSKDKEVYIRIYGPKIFASNYLCDSMDTLSDLISWVTDDTEVYLIDDYAEDSVYVAVENALEAQGIRYKRLESDRN